MEFARRATLAGCLFGCLILQFPLQLAAVAPRTGPGPKVAPRIVVQSVASQSTQLSSIQAPAKPQQAYTLPPGKLAKAIALGRIRNILGLVGALWDIGFLFLFLASHAAARLESWTQRVFHRRWLQGLLFFAAFIVLDTLAFLPVNLYAHHISVAYGIGVQGWASWLLDHAKALAIALMAAPVFLLFNWIVRRWPRRYWLGAWAVTLPLMLFSAFGEPFLEPIFNQYEPLAKTHPSLVAELEKVVARTGTNIPPERMFLMKASAKSNGINAYVSGLGATQRIVVWDTTADRLPADEILFFCGHETGHYVLHHIPKGLAFTAVALFFVYWACAWIAACLARRLGARWALNVSENQPNACAPSIAFSANGGNRPPLSTRSGFILLLFTISVAGFVLAPVDNSISRHYEHDADIYGQEAIHGIVPDPQKTATAAFNALGEAWLDDPNPSPLIEFWTYNHPSTQSRATFAAHYDPWSNGGHGKFFDK
jgi:Zn-dependent protease with chaperone function